MRLIPVLLILHIAYSLLYVYSQYYIEDYDTYIRGITYQDLYSALYFGGEAFFFGSFLIAVLKRYNRFEEQLVWMEVIFVWLRGIFYVVDDLGLYTTNTAERLTFIMAYLLIASVIISLMAQKHGFLKDE